MGHAHSNPSAALQTCLDAVCSRGAACVAYPSDPLFQLDWVRPYNLAVNVTPAAVVRPADAAQVAAVVRCAAANNVSVQARSGGHSYANYGLGGGSSGDGSIGGGIAIDLALLDQFSMDTATWQATIGPAATLGTVTQQLVDHGNRAFAHGVCPGVGMGGHATVGGLGPMSRMWGACLDHIVEAEVVTADGRIVRASDTENPDLFFALRGAGSSFGIVTEFVMRTHPAPGSVVQYTFEFAFGGAAALARTYTAWQALVGDPALDRRFGTEFVLYPLGAVITGTFYGTQAEWDATGIAARLPPAANTTLVVHDWLGSLAQAAENEALYLSDTPTSFYAKSLGLRREDLLTPAHVADLFAYVASAAKGTLLWFIVFDASGGAVADAAATNATAFAQRDKVLFYQSYAVLDLVVPEPLTSSAAAPTVAFLTAFHERLLATLPASVAVGTYPGYVDPALAQPQQEYYGANLPALQRIKAAWDPNQVFRNPQSVQPATA
ncbi:FAD-binding, type 2 [Niveomyces insectorum RCEF 264]|uniref:FAD-binding, type 2 n=1 Tax=Niveomyces insectorum RCEF 264 TaxID=1081102 RepID=A0A167RWH7_9HYPO|nr:FAD-binding, type 2 [Niveomyces insectorum RCEF 264]